MYFVYRENYIPGVGTPLVLVAMGNRDQYRQAVERYLFVYGVQKIFVPEIRDWSFHDKIEADVITYEQFEAEAIAATEAQLECLVAKTYGGKYDAYLSARGGFKKADKPAFEIVNRGVRHCFRDELRRIAEITQNEELATLIEARCQYTLSSRVTPVE